MLLKRFAPLFSTNFFGVLNDNLLKTLACFIAVDWVANDNKALIISCAAAALVLPYVLLSPLAGRIAQNYNRRNIVVWAKIAELPIISLGICGFAIESTALVLTSILLMGIQSALFSPAKYGLIRDIGGETHLSFGVGGMEGVSFLGMLCGMLIASFLADNDPSLTISYSLLVLFALTGLILSFSINKHPKYSNNELTNEEVSTNPIKGLIDMYKSARKFKGLNNIIFGLSIFWWLAALLQIGLLIYCREVLLISSWHTGIILSTAAIGITSGCILSGIIFKKRRNFFVCIIAGISMSILLILLFFITLSPSAFGCVIFIIALLGGFFKVPLDSEIQHTAKGNFLSIALAYFNQVSFIFILLASLTLSLISLTLNIKYIFAIMGIVMLCATLFLLFTITPVLVSFVRTLINWRYKIVVRNLEALKPECNYLILPNHSAVIDPVILICTLYNIPIRPFVDELYVTTPVVGAIVRKFNPIAVPNILRNRASVNCANQLLSRALDALKNGDNILLYASGQITLDGTEKIGNKKLAHQIAPHIPSNTQVIGIRMNGLWGSSFSRYNRKSTPNVILTLICSLPKFFVKRRVVNIELLDITAQIKDWSQLERRSFNKKLEEFYNEESIS